MSTFSDATGAEEERGKGDTPKEETACKSNLGHTVKSRVTVIRLSDGVLSKRILKDSFAGTFVSAIFHF